MPKNRYKKEGDIIKDLDASYTASEIYETDESLQVTDENGTYRYKVVDGSHVLRTQPELDTDYLPTYITEKLNELRELFTTRWSDSSKAISANQAQYNIAKTNISGASSLTDVDTAYSTFESFMDLP